MPIDVKTPVYEGPLELLLELVEKRKLLINDISLSEVTQEYIDRVQAMGELPIGEIAEFVALAATLLLIKSRSLLPTLELTENESRDIKELEYRLALYQIIKESSKSLANALKEPYLHEGVAPEREARFLFDDSITLESLRAAAQALIDGFPQNVVLPKVAVKKIISLEDMITELAERVGKAAELSFKAFHAKGVAVDPQAKHHVIVSFLALLELVKRGIIEAQQHEQYGDISLSHAA
jgi:segregation and condensation protein A